MTGALCCFLLLSPWQPFLGRWDLTVTSGTGEYASWLEITDSGGAAPNVRLVGRVSSVHSIPDATVVSGHLRFSTKEYFGAYERVDYDLAPDKDRLNGAITREKGMVMPIRGERAPDLKRKPVERWSQPIALLNGTDLTGWEPTDAQRSRWKAAGGNLVNEGKGSNIRTTQLFDDFKLHLEFRAPAGANTGVYLRGRYEIQIQVGPCANLARCLGSVYGFLEPLTKTEAKPDEWRSLDAELVGRTVTVMLDGKLLIDAQEIPGVTGGALDSHEGLPGPILLQGDHSGNEYRNIRIQTAVR